LSFPWNRILQDGFILSFVVMGFWWQKSLAVILSLLTAILLGAIEYYSLPPWNNLLRAFLILILIIYLVFWARKIGRSQNQML
jgi:hypothetical protein